ncbi:unnamed protein product, partial [Effrenium voratum]
MSFGELEHCDEVVNFGKAAFDMGKEARNSNVGDALKQLPGVVQQGASLCAQVAGALEAVSVTAGCGGVSLMASVASSALNGEDTAGAMDAGMQQLADKLRQTKEDIESQIMQSTAKLLNAVTTAEQHLSQNSQEKRQYLMEDVATFVTNLKSGRKMPDLYLDMQKMQHRFNKTGLENYLRDLKGAGVSPDQILTAAAAFLATRAKIMLLQGSAVRNTDEVKRAAADFQSDIEGMKKVLADFQDLRLTHTLADADDWILSVAWAPDGRLAVGGNDNKVRVYDEDLRLTHTLADAVMSVAWAPDGRLAAGGLDHKVRVYDEDLRLTRTLADADDWIISVAWAPDGRLAVGGNDNKVRVYDEDLRLTHTLADAVFEIHFVAWAPDGRLAAGGDDNKVRVYDEDLRLTHTLADADFAIHFVAWAPDGRLAAGGDDHKVRVYDEVEEETWNNSKAEASLDQNMLDLVDPYNKGVVRYAADSLQRAPSDHLRKGAELDRRPEARRRSGYLSIKVEVPAGAECDPHICAANVLQTKSRQRCMCNNKRSVSGVYAGGPHSKLIPNLGARFPTKNSSARQASADDAEDTVESQDSLQSLGAYPQQAQPKREVVSEATSQDSQLKANSSVAEGVSGGSEPHILTVPAEDSQLKANSSVAEGVSGGSEPHILTVPAEAIADALKSNKCAKEIILDDNRIGDQGAQ